MEEYQPDLIATLAVALNIDNTPFQWEHINATTEKKDVMIFPIRVKANTKQKHRNLGHPLDDALSEFLVARGTSESIMEAAKGCLECAKYKKPAQAAPASTSTLDQFNDVVQADVLWIRRGSTKYAIISVVDIAIRYIAADFFRSSVAWTYYGFPDGYKKNSGGEIVYIENKK